VFENHKIVNGWIVGIPTSHHPIRLEKPMLGPVFGSVEPERVVAWDRWFLVIRDKYPLTEGHCLIIPRRPAARFEDLKPLENRRLIEWIGWTQGYLEKTLVPPPDGFNLGANDGDAAGQTMAQFHFHVIPRYRGDVADPRGGIRWVIPSRARYWGKD
jgi:diadenosine tetraphosphate (Ap4A) HIT family hydrolase